MLLDGASRGGRYVRDRKKTVDDAVAGVRRSSTTTTCRHRLPEGVEAGVSVEPARRAADRNRRHRSVRSLRSRVAVRRPAEGPTRHHHGRSRPGRSRDPAQCPQEHPGAGPGPRALDRREPAVPGRAVALRSGRGAARRRWHRGRHRRAHRRRARDGVGRRCAATARSRAARAQPAHDRRARAGLDQQGDHGRDRVGERPHHARQRVHRFPARSRWVATSSRTTRSTGSCR